MPPQGQTDPFEEAMRRAEAQLNQHPAAGPQATGPGPLINSGLLETAGGIFGGAIGSIAGPEMTIPGAMAGAGLTRYIRGLTQGQSVPEAVVRGAGSAALEGAPGLVGKGLQKLGGAVVRSTLPRDVELFADVGRGNPFRGRTLLGQAVTEGPGMTPRRAFEAEQGFIKGAENRVGQITRDATRRGITIDADRAARLARANVERVAKNVQEPGGVTAANEVLGRYAAQPTQPLLGRSVMTPVEMRQIQQATQYVPGAVGRAAPETAKLLRIGMSHEMKRAIPELADPLKLEASHIPVRNLLAQMVPGAETPGIRAGLHGGAGVGVPTALAKAIVFAGGKATNRTGQMLDSLPGRFIPGAIRLLSSH